MFPTLCIVLGAKYLKTTAYHLQTNEQVKRYNHTIVTRLWNCIARSQKNQATYVQPLRYEYSAQAYKSTNTSYFSLLLSRRPPGLTTVSLPSALIPNSYVDTDPWWLGLNIQRMVAVLHDKTNYQMRSQNPQYKRYYNPKIHVKSEFESNRWVFVDKLQLTGKTNTGD